MNSGSVDGFDRARIETATSQDIPQLADLLSLLFTQEAEFTPDVRLQGEGLALIVAPDCRGKGLGTRLLTEAIAVARARKCGRITLLTDCGNEHAQRLYARHGFIASGMIPMRLLL